MNDKFLRKLVIDELDWEPSVDAADIGVAVDNGIVHLTGRIGSYPQKLAAEAAVKRVKGVRGYVEDLEIRSFAGAFSDETIAGQVANLIDWDITVPKNAVKVKVDRGFVTLSGKVEWQFQRQAAERGVRNLPGVRGLANEIQVTARPQTADIKRRIQDALERQADLDAGRIIITVDGDKVRLDGKVRAWFEKDLIEQAAWGAPGVRSVEDRVSIEL